MSIGSAAAQGIESGFGLGLRADEAKQRRYEFEREQAARDEAQARLAKQEDDRYGRMNDAARMQAVEARMQALEKMATSIAQSGHEVPPGIQQERAQLSVQLEDMQQQVATTGRLAPTTGAITGPAPRPNVASAEPPTAPLSGAPIAAPQPAAAASQPAGPLASAAGAAQPAAGLGPSYGPASAAAPADATAAAPVPAVPGGAPPTAAVASPVTSARTPGQQFVADADQQSQDLSSRLSTGQISLSDVKPGDFALMVASATKRDPRQLDQVRQHINDWEAGMQTGNNGLLLQGVNGIFGPQVAQGVGAPSAYGGTITGKSVIGLDPAMSANGAVHADKVIPRLRVTTDVKGPDGTPLYYDAPMTTNRSSDPDDPVRAVSMGDAVNHIGALSTLVTAASHPDAQALIAKGATDPRVQQYLDAYTAASAPANPALVKENQIKQYMSAAGVDRDTAIDRMTRLGVLPQVKGGVAQAYETAQQMVSSGEANSIPEALGILQAGGVTKQRTKYSQGAVASGSLAGGAGPLASAAGGNLALSGDDYLKTLPATTQARVKNIAANPDLLKNIPETKGQRAAMADMVLQYKPDAQLGASGAAGGMSGRNQAFTNRILTGASESVADLANIVELPVGASQGWFGTAKPGTTLLSAPQSVLGNKMTSEEAQGYNVLASGLQRNLASIETAGLAPTAAFVDQLGKLQFNEGDTELTKLRKLAQTRQIVEKGLDSVISDPKLAAGQRDMVNSIIGQIRKSIPFTQHDLTALQAKWNDDPNATLASVMSARGLAAPTPHAAAPAGAPPSAAPVQIHDDAGFHALPSGALFVGPDGVTRRKP